MAVERVFSFQRRPQHGFLPTDGAAAAVQAKQDPLLRVQGRDGEQIIRPQDRRSVTRARQGGFPNDVARGRPMNGNFLFQAGSVQTRSAPARPILGANWSWPTEEEQKKPVVFAQAFHQWVGFFFTMARLTSPFLGGSLDFGLRAVGFRL